MADIDILRDELINDPLNLGYTTLQDNEVAELLNVQNRQGYGVVPAPDVRRYVLLNGIFPKLQSVATNSKGTATEAQQGTAITILQVIAPNSFDEIRMNEPVIRAAVVGMLQVMVDAGAMTDQQRTAMIALGDRQVSRGEELGIGYITHEMVGEARRV